MTKYTAHSIDGDIPFDAKTLTELREELRDAGDWSDEIPIPVTDDEGREVGRIDPYTGDFEADSGLLMTEFRTVLAEAGCDDPIIVEDGCFEWVGSQKELIAHMASHGWTVHRPGYVDDGEEAISEDARKRGEPSPYAVLCQDCAPYAGEGAVLDIPVDLGDAIPRMYPDQQTGPDVWSVPESLTTALLEEGEAISLPMGQPFRRLPID